MPGGNLEVIGPRIAEIQARHVTGQTEIRAANGRRQMTATR
jgi:hypothetical protein